MGNPLENSFGIQLGASLGTNGFKANLSVFVDHRVSSFAGACGFGVTYYSNFFQTNKKGFEFRGSAMLGFSDGTTELYLGTNQWLGVGQMNEFRQRTGMIAFRSGNFRFSYENDGTPFGIMGLGDGEDRYRTAAASIGIGEFSLKMNLLTGYRDFAAELKRFQEGNEVSQGKGTHGETYHHDFAIEPYSRYRYGGLTLNYHGMEAGVNSEWVSHAFQNVLAHHWLKPQSQFKMLSGDWKFVGYPSPDINTIIPFQTTQFTIWK